MKQDKDWIDVMRSTLRDAETPPPADGWARLERELGNVPAPRVPVWRIHWPRIAAAAAAVVICIAVGEYLWRADQDLKGFDGNVISEAVSGGSSADRMLAGVTGADSVSKTDAAAPLASEAAVTGLAANTPASAVPARRSVNKLVQTVSAPHRIQIARQNVPETFAARSEAQDGNRETTPGTPADASSAQGSKAADESTSTAKDAAASKSTSRPSAEPARRTTAQASSRTLYEGDFVAYTPPRKKASFSLYGGGGVTGGTSGGVASRMQSGPSNSPSGTTGAGGSISLMKQYDYARGSFRHHQPLSFGLSVRKEFAHGLSLESGVNYTFLNSDVSLFSGSEEMDQKLHFIGVPLRLNWQFLERGRFSLYIGAGGMVEKCVSARFDGKASEEPRVQWSVLGAAGAQYRLGGTVSLYFEPEVSYYFTETELRTVRTDSPLTLTLRMGVRLSF